MKVVLRVKIYNNILFSVIRILEDYACTDEQ